MDQQHSSPIDLTVDIVTAYLSRNQIAADQVPALIASVHSALSGAGVEPAEPEEVVEKPSASQVRKSLTDDGLISFVDGKTYKSLKRHLSRHGFTPDSYRETFGLRSDYPMVAPAYSRARSEMAKAIGLGAKGRQVTNAKRKPKAAQSTA